jgi:hypothetical protein
MSKKSIPYRIEVVVTEHLPQADPEIFCTCPECAKGGVAYSGEGSDVSVAHVQQVHAERLDPVEQCVDAVGINPLRTLQALSFAMATVIDGLVEDGGVSAAELIAAVELTLVGMTGREASKSSPLLENGFPLLPEEAVSPEEPLTEAQKLQLKALEHDPLYKRTQ